MKQSPTRLNLLTSLGMPPPSTPKNHDSSSSSSADDAEKAFVRSQLAPALTPFLAGMERCLMEVEGAIADSESNQ